ncbi:MAG: hypothetical protein JWQ83_1489, partial [Lacunisphaera sp.]|nr:hypothetical protein [Lacunisphaera sp.]
MNGDLPQNRDPLWRNWRFWLLLWAGATLVFAGLLIWDARSWIAGAPQG